MKSALWSATYTLAFNAVFFFKNKTFSYVECKTKGKSKKQQESKFKLALIVRIHIYFFFVHEFSDSLAQKASRFPWLKRPFFPLTSDFTPEFIMCSEIPDSHFYFPDAFYLNTNNLICFFFLATRAYFYNPYNPFLYNPYLYYPYRPFYNPYIFPFRTDNLENVMPVEIEYESIESNFISAEISAESAETECEEEYFPLSENEDDYDDWDQNEAGNPSAEYEAIP